MVRGAVCLFARARCCPWCGVLCFVFIVDTISHRKCVSAHVFVGGLGVSISVPVFCVATSLHYWLEWIISSLLPKHKVHKFHKKVLI